jgi:DNA gyrase subunit A
MATKGGIVKKTQLTEYDSNRKGGLIAISLDDDDDLIDVKLTDGAQDVIIGTQEGVAISFPEDNVRAMGRNTRGVRGIKLEEGDIVIGMDTLKAGCEVLSVTSEGFGKRTSCDEYRRQARGGKGIINMKVTEKTGKVVGIKVVHAGQEMMLISTDGIVIRIKVDEISVISRNTQGVKVMRTDSDDRVAAIAIAERKTEADA